MSFYLQPVWVIGLKFKNMSDKKTCSELEYEWGDSTDKRSCKQYIYDYMDQELASLREQLQKETERADVGRNLFVNCQKKLKQKEEENRELRNKAINDCIDALCDVAAGEKYYQKIKNELQKLLSA